jgi:hypothetical protein
MAEAFQFSNPTAKFDTAGTDTTIETSPPYSIADQPGWRLGDQVVSKTVQSKWRD